MNAENTPAADSSSAIAPDKPLVFISHKHEDKEIAETVAKFVRDMTGGRANVYLSSSPNFAGPRIGKDLNAELRSALTTTGLVLMVYTSDDKDWSWCMWECGLAEDPKTADTNVVVIQCLSGQTSDVFSGKVLAVAGEEASIVNFAQHFGESDFYPGLGSPLSELNDGELKERALTFREKLLDSLPKATPENWAVWPWLRLSFPRESIETVKGLPKAERFAAMRQLLVEQATVEACSPALPSLFSMAQIDDDTTFSRLLAEWQDTYPNGDSRWVDCIAHQLVDGARKNTPSVEKWYRFRPVNGHKESVPGIGRIRSGALSFSVDCYFFDVIEVPPVTSLMQRYDTIYHVDLAQRSAESIVLVDQLKELEERRWNRIPIFEDKKPKFIIHVSMIDRFLRTKALAEEALGSLTLADLLAPAEFRGMFETTFALVGCDATVAEARRAMRKVSMAQDVFVTEHGNNNEPVLGWLTDRELLPPHG